MLTTHRARLFSVVALVSLLLSSWGLAAKQEKELTLEEREQLEIDARRLDKEAMTQYRRKDYGAATRTLKRALAVRERLYGKHDDAELARNLDSLGFLLYSTGQAAQALPYWERSLAMRERHYPKGDHADLAQS